jgi:hypothetical protein
MTLVTGDGNGEEEAMGCNHFQRGRERGGEAASGWRSKMTKENLVGVLNVWLGRTTDWADEKI